MTDYAGIVRARYEYDPWGRTQQLEGDLVAELGYTGHYRHHKSGFYLAPFRAYDPVNARWLNRDPIKENGGINVYGYVGNRPISFLDPHGHFAIGSIGIGKILLDLGLSVFLTWIVWDLWNEETECSDGDSEQQETPQKKVKKPGLTGKEGAKDKPSWVTDTPNCGESGKEFADRMMNDQYGEGNWNNNKGKPERGPGSEHSKIKKWADRSFIDPPSSMGTGPVR